MPDKPAPKKRSGRRGDPLSAHPLTPEQFVRGIFAIKPGKGTKK